jgi:hypothetical protein
LFGRAGGPPLCPPEWGRGPPGLLNELEGNDDYALEFLRVKKEIDGVVISSIRSLGDIRAGGIQNSLFFVGINAAGLSAQNRIPNTPHNFERNSRVRSITISACSSVGFSHTVIAAKEIGDLRLGRCPPRTVAGRSGAERRCSARRPAP